MTISPIKRIQNKSLMKRINHEKKLLTIILAEAAACVLLLFGIVALVVKGIKCAHKAKKQDCACRTKDASDGAAAYFDSVSEQYVPVNDGKAE